MIPVEHALRHITCVWAGRGTPHFTCGMTLASASLRRWADRRSQPSMRNGTRQPAPARAAAWTLNGRPHWRRIALCWDEDGKSRLGQDLKLNIDEVVLTGGCDKERNEQEALQVLTLRSPRRRLHRQFADVIAYVLSRLDSSST
jgi:hypothetical protein